MTNEIVDEIRKFRDDYAKKFNYDLQKMYEDIKKREAEAEKAGQKFVALPPRKRKEAA